MTTATLGVEYLWLGGTTETADAPSLLGRQTWNNVAIAFTGWRLNITDTFSAEASKLLDLQVGGATRFLVLKEGVVRLRAATNSSPTNGDLWFDGTDLKFRTGGVTKTVTLT